MVTYCITSDKHRLRRDITVNSSRYAVPFYEGLGFIQYEDEKSIFGVIHIPMVLSLSNIKQLAK
ncbi:MAG: GNAT family N-acetyltransferase [Candidatus Dadabacteria bacterium]|nr:GNAT family N-acetyltransferase [Candidatus Dadabacteria bacterium]